MLFYKKDALCEAIYNCATGRMQAVINLLVNLYEYHNCDPAKLRVISVVAALLLNDAYSLLKKLTLGAIKARYEKGEVFKFNTQGHKNIKVS